MDEFIKQNIINWIDNENYSAVLRQEIQDLLDENNEKELIDRFYKNIEFGTGGIRGIVGAGINRLNIFNIRKVTQGVCDYIYSLNIKDPTAVIGFDCRLSSIEFAKGAAEVFAANKINVHFYDEFHPTPLISYAVRKLKATVGIVITASHNPPNYNGYKVCWSDGCQVTAPHDQGIINCVDKLTEFNNIKCLPWEKALNDKLINMIPTEIDENYYNDVISLLPKEYNKNFNKGIIYTPLHGVGYAMVNELMNRREFINYSAVKSQQVPDGNFPTLKSPNPEDVKSMDEAIKISQSNDYLILANDPDADRLGVMVNEDNTWKRLDGNQIGQIFIYYWLNLLKETNKLPTNGFIISTIVSSTLGKKIAADFNVKWYETLTGFKYIGSKINENLDKGEQFIFAYEESFGYQFGDYIREKDGISASLIFAELFRYYDQKGKKIFQILDEIYLKYGYHTDYLVNKVIPGKDGAEMINKIMLSLRNVPPNSIGSENIIAITDYSKLTHQHISNNSIEKINSQLKSNVISYHFNDGTRLSVRPSGTEPKIKFYFNLSGSSKSVIENKKKEYVSGFNQIIEKITNS